MLKYEAGVRWQDRMPSKDVTKRCDARDKFENETDIAIYNGLHTWEGIQGGSVEDSGGN